MNYAIQIIEDGTGRRSTVISGSPLQLTEALTKAQQEDYCKSEDRIIVIYEYESAVEEAEFSTKPVVTVQNFLHILNAQQTQEVATNG